MTTLPDGAPPAAEPTPPSAPTAPAPAPTQAPAQAPTPVAARRSAGHRLDAGLVALGVALLATADLVSAIYSRRDGDLDWSNYAVGLGATAVLLLVALVGRVAVRDRDLARQVASWPVAAGAVGAGVMVGVGVHGVDQVDHVAYLVGGVIAGLGVVGYLLAPSAPPALATVAGLVVLYGQGVDDTVTFDRAEANPTIASALEVTAFVVVVTLLASALRPARVVVGVTVGFGGVLGFVGLLSSLGLLSFFGGGGLLGRGGADYFDDGGYATYLRDYRDDIYVVLGLAGALMLFWLVLAWLTDAVGFRLLVVAMAVPVVPLAMSSLLVAHPTWWSAVGAAAGGLVLGLAGLRSRRAGHAEDAGPSDVDGPDDVRSRRWRRPRRATSDDASFTTN